MALLLVARAAAAEDAPLLVAARARDLARVRALIAERVDVDVTQPDGATALHWATHWQHLEMVDALVRAGASVNVSNDLGVTPLAMACDAAGGAMVSRLLQAGAVANERPVRRRSSQQGEREAARPTPLMLCARRGNIEGVEALIAARANVNAAEPRRGQTALMWAAANRQPEIVRLLLNAGADPRARSQVTRVMINRADPNDIYTAVIGEVPMGRSTAFLFAASRGDVASAKLLLAAGSAVDDVTADGTSALVIAVHSGHPEMAAWLIEQGANVNASGAGYTPLHAAVLRGDVDTVKLLIARRAQVNARIAHGTQTIRAGRGYVLPENLTGGTPALLAAKFLERDILRILISAGADLRVTLADGTTALMVAAGLLTQGSLLDRRGRVSALNEPDEPAALATLDALLAVGADVNAVNAQGDTALHGAAARGYRTSVSRLLERGARTEIANAKGQKAFDVADSKVKDLLAR